MNETNLLTHPTLLFDGVCNLCNQSVQAVIQVDEHKIFRFASLQSEAGQSAVKRILATPDDLDSVILVDGDQVHIKSDAVLRVLYHLGGYYRMLYLFRFVPRFIRDFIYDWIARNRYTWFGKRDVCMVPTPDLESRFLS